jgi:dolichyl-phosphate-mannose-protein mannosyltransferase
MISKSSAYSLSGFLIILVLSFYTYIPGYQKPASLFWDENFHIASAQRYLNGVFFLEPHPPLGKLVIAAGEYLFKFNEKNDQFISEEKADKIPDGFSFAGYRFFPVILAALIAPVIYIIVFKLSHSNLASFLIALAPTFDNAMIVHNRGAMLESTQIFFLLLSALSYVSIYQNRNNKFISYVLLGIFCGLSIATKVNSLPILLLPLLLLYTHKEFKQWALGFIASFILTYLLVWQIHFLLARNVNNQLDGDGFFGVSNKYQNIILDKKSSSAINLLKGISESFDYFHRYQKGVPTLDYNKVDENGSHPLLWPIGARTINYRWQQDGNKLQYLYLVPNIASWLVGLLGIVVALVELIKAKLSSDKLNISPHLIPFCLIYFATWLSPILMNRVFYLYHYFVPLSFSWLILGCCINSHKKLKLSHTALISIIIIFIYIFFSPLTYYKGITNAEFRNRSWIKYWDLRCNTCPSIYSTSSVLNRSSSTDESWKLSVSGLEANYIEQTAGTPIQDGRNLEVQTESKIQFPLNNKYSFVHGVAKLSQSKFTNNVILKIFTNGKVIWEHTFTPSSQQSQKFNVPLNDSIILTLTAQTDPQDSGSVGAVWQDMELVIKDSFSSK